MMNFTLSNKLRAFIKNSTKTSPEFFDLYQSEHKGESINLYVSHKRTGKSTHIHCTESGDIVWEQFYPFGGMSKPTREKKYVLKPICDKNAITIVIIRGTPGNITGLESRSFKSHLSAPEKSSVYLMTEKNAIKFLESI